MLVAEIMVSFVCIVALIVYIACKISNRKDRKWNRNGVIAVRAKDLQSALIKASKGE